MDSIDLFSLRTHFNRNRILLSFNGPISRSLIEEIGNALKNYLPKMPSRRRRWTSSASISR